MSDGVTGARESEYGDRLAAARGRQRDSDRSGPPHAGRQYSVRQGDSLWSMASRLYRQGQWWEAIRLANSQAVDGSGNVAVGTDLYLPTLEEAREIMEAARDGEERAVVLSMDTEA